MVRWYEDWDQSDDALLYCPWTMFYDIIEAVATSKHRAIPAFASIGDMIVKSVFLGSTLDDIRRKATREFNGYVQRINTLFRIHNMAYSLRNNEVVPTGFNAVQHQVSKALAVAEPTEVDRLREAWKALNSRPDPKLKLAVEQMRGVFDNIRTGSWLPEHINHSEPNSPAKPMGWHMSEAVHHAYRAACKVIHDEGTPTKADAMMSVFLGASLVIYRDTLAEQSDQSED